MRGDGLASQPWILAGKQSALLTRIRDDGSVWLYVRMKSNRFYGTRIGDPGLRFFLDKLA